MVLKLHLPEHGPKIIGGKLIPPGTFYEEGEADLVTTTNNQAWSHVPFLSPPSGLSGGSQKSVVTDVPAYDDITVSQMKEELDAMGVDYSAHTKDKATLYAFYVEVKKSSGNDAE